MLAHHDGSALYVGTPAPRLGERVPVWLRTGPAVTGVHVRSVPDGEPHFTEAIVDRVVPSTVDSDRPAELWWRAEVEVRNPDTRYRFLLHGAGRTRWLTARGPADHDVTDATDFRLVAHPAPPAWGAEAIVYQIFPDRFARSAAADTRPVPDWAEPCGWDEPVIGRGPRAEHQFYGGDLDGVIGHLDHVVGLGATAVYLTPIFPARSNHRYDASTFDRIDPLLGGDKALRRLSAAVHARGLRLIGDITSNHTGDSHEWFTGPAAREMYYLDPDGRYESWLGVPTLPKLNWNSAELRARFAGRPDSVVRRWLTEFDGWRVDVANMTGRRGADQLTHAVAREIARAVREVRPDGLLIAEHGHDAAGDLDVGGWQGTMNYPGFTRPVWTWLRGPALDLPDFLGVPGGVPVLPGRAVLAAMREVSSRMSWRSLSHSWNMLDSHDTARFATVAGDPARVEAGLGLLATLPGTPMVFAGDELGLTGVNGEDARVPMPWHRPDRWHRPTLDRYRSLLRLRRDQPALRHGGLRLAYVEDDAIGYWRETAGSRLLVLVRRAAGMPVRIAGWPGRGTAENLYGGAPLPARDGQLTLPGDGPTVQIWRCPAADLTPSA